MPHTFKHNETNLKLLETVIGRLKYSIRPSILVKWLENFKEDEVPIALNLLRYFEYIDSNELLMRLDHLLKELLEKIGKNNDKVLFVPFAKYGKSSTLITYPLTHLKRFQDNEDRFIISSDFEKICKEEVIRHVVFIDDFVGSGETFIKSFNKLKLFPLFAHDSTYLLCPIIMEKAKEKINRKTPYIKILSEVRFRFLESDLSAIKMSKTENEISNLVLYYGNRIPANSYPTLYIPKGYKDSESLISFFYRTPNNTFPVIWGDKNWFPLYPRTSRSLINQTRHFKKDITYYLNSFLNSSLDFELDEKFIDDSSDKRNSKTILTQKNNYLLLSVLVLKYNFLGDFEKTNLFICSFLGLTREELKHVFIEGKNKGYFHKKTLELTDKSRQLLNELFNERKKTSIRQISPSNLEINYGLFLPKTFRGSS